MASRDWTDPKTWLEGERLKADEVTEQFTDNLIWLFEKNWDIVQVSGVSDYQTTSTTPAIMGVMFCTIKKATNESLVRVAFNGSAYNSNASTFVRFDVLVDGIYYASSGTGTPATGGLMTFQQDTAGIQSQVMMEAFLTDLDAGFHDFQLVWWVSANTGTINVTNTIAQFHVEEYGVGNVNNI